MALGAVAGGAHANPRPSFFVGGPGVIAEHEQPFDAWGGENAVGITGVAASPDRLLLVGQWAPDGHRASGALWTSADGRSYVRHDRSPASATVSAASARRRRALRRTPAGGSSSSGP